MRIEIVGVCASGKSTLILLLTQLGYAAYGVAQEHSCVPWLWLLSKPDILVVLDCEYATARQRRAIAWGPERLRAERERLAHALGHCDLYIRTDKMSPEDVVRAVVDTIRRLGGGENRFGRQNRDA
ncbi:MAG TPA: hypothetical protein GXX40_09595 [Firmicutes bacterium]|nr:hypothetical protein [Bacillota bacterium]